MNKLALMHKLLTGLAQEVDATAQQYNQANRQIFMEAFNLLTHSTFNGEEATLESYCFQYQVKPVFSLTLMENSLRIASRLMVDNLSTAASPAIVKSFPNLNFNLAQDQELWQQLGPLLLELKQQTKMNQVIRDIRSYSDLSLAQFQIFTSLLHNALFSA